MSSLSSTTVLKFVKLSEKAFAPVKGSDSAAGFDLRSAYEYIIPARGKSLIKTDLQVALPQGTYGRIAPRSGLAWKNHLDIGADVIDQDYRGNIQVVIFNHGKKSVRYMAIMRPLKHHMSRKRTILALFSIWFASAMLAIPCLLYSTTNSRRYNNGNTRIVCYMQWPDGSYPNSKTEYIYNLVFLGVTYLIPMMVMAVCYTLMGRKLWGSKSIGELTQYQKESMKSKRKVVKMFIIVVTIFAVCWLPYHGFFIYAYHHRRFAETSYAQHVFLSFYWLAMSNAMVNPIIYYWMNTRFRLYFQQIICKCCCVIGRSNLRTRQMHELAGFHRSGILPSHSGHVRSVSIRWRHSNAETHVQALKTNSRSICEKIHSRDDVAII